TGGPELVHHQGAGLQRGPALGSPRCRLGPRLALAGLAGRGRPVGRARGRGLPLDAVLRMRGLPGNGHRDPDRAHWGYAASAANGFGSDRSLSGPGQGVSEAGVPSVTCHLVVRYAKRGRMRFASHRDIARAVERGVRRAGLPIAYSAGFTSHPKISYAGAAPTGAASEAEYLELSLTRACAGSEVRERLDAALPD